MNDDRFYDEIGRIGWQDIHHKTLKDLAYILPNSMLLVQGGLIQGLDDKTILENISKGDIHPDYAETYLDAIWSSVKAHTLLYSAVETIKFASSGLMPMLCS
ncbi:unnamed protein product, partial [marine sediment metagenome]